MGRPRQVSDEQILSATRDRVFAEGPSVSLEVVAEELGVSVPALLKRFGSRRALMLAALRPPAPEWVDVVKRGPGEGSLELQLSEMFQLISDFFSKAIPCMTALRESGISMREVYTERPTRGLDAVARWLRLARDQGLVTATELETAAFAIVGALQARVFFAHLMKAPISPRAQREYITELASFFARALTPAHS
jgi:AcrR family transcriptional regulator